MREARSGEVRRCEFRDEEEPSRDEDGDEGVDEPERDGVVERVGLRVVLQLACGGRDDDDRGLYDGLCEFNSKVRRQAKWMDLVNVLLIANAVANH